MVNEQYIDDFGRQKDDGSMEAATTIDVVLPLNGNSNSNVEESTSAAPDGISDSAPLNDNTDQNGDISMAEAVTVVEDGNTALLPETEAGKMEDGDQ